MTSPTQPEEGASASSCAASLPPPLPTPIVLESEVVKGYGRGSKLLGIPTANLDIAVVGPYVEDIPTGIYYGWAFLRGQIYASAISIGWNPYFNNQKRTVEPHLIHQFDDDFYGERLRLLVCGYVRPEKNFPSLEALVAAIWNDIEVSKKKLEGDPLLHQLAHAHKEWTTSPFPPETGDGR